jgi:hypothetical protein
MENRNEEAFSSVGSSQLRINLPSARALTRGEKLPERVGTDSSRQLLCRIKDVLLELQPLSPPIVKGTAAIKPTAALLWSNSLRVIAFFFITQVLSLLLESAHGGADSSNCRMGRYIEPGDL